MDKTYGELPILGEVVKKRKKSERLMLFWGIPTALLLEAIMLLAAADKKSGIMVPILVSLFIVIIISGMISSYFQVDRLTEKVMDKLSISSPDKMERFLEKCQKIDDLVFFSDDSIIDFYKYDVIKIRSITHVELDNSDSDGNRFYVVKMKVRAEGTKKLCFQNSEERDKAYKLITAAIDFTDRDKYSY